MTSRGGRFNGDVLRTLLTPRWIVAGVVVAVVASVFVGLGRWQLSRHDEKVLENEVRTARLTAQPVEIDELLAGAGDDVGSLEYRRSVAVGAFRPSQEVLLRSRVRDGVAGFEVVTPFELETGTVLMVDRGWVPLSFDQVPVEQAPPPTGTVQLSGVLRLGAARGALQPEDPEGSVLSRVDLDRLATMVDGPLAPVWMQLVDDEDETLPLAAPEPVFDDNGPHLSYAFQWFSFAVIAVVGFVLLVRRQIGRR